MNNFVTDAINLKAYNLSELIKLLLCIQKIKGLLEELQRE